MIKVENFESYFKKQQADSNCGFAEEYEVCAFSGERELHDKYFWKDKSFFLWSMHKAYWRAREGSFLYRDDSAVCIAFPSFMQLQI